MNSRRTFIKQAGIAAAGALLMPSCAFKPSKKVGIQLYSLREQLPKDVTGVIRKVAQTGYKEVETYGYSLQSKFWGLEPKAFSNLLKENGLMAPSGHYSMDKFMLDGNPEELKTYIEAANIIGSSYVTVPYLGAPLRNSLDDYKKIAERLNQAATLCKASGLKLAYHNHDFEFKAYGDSNGYETMMKETQPDLVEFELDIYWVVRSGLDPVKLFQAHPGRFSMWHIKDLDKTNETLNTEVGNGTIDFKKIYENAKVAGLKHSFMEQENFAIDPFVSIKRSYDYIDKELI